MGSPSPVIIDYTNWQSERRERKVLPEIIWWGQTDWHLEPQWLLRALDCETNRVKDFALLQVHGWRRVE